METQVFKSKLTRTEREDLAYRLMTIKADQMELKLGERTHVDTIYEGRTNFKYEVLFCDSKDKVKSRKITVSTKGY
jgi:hypothetical protein